MQLMINARVLHDRDGALENFAKQVQVDPGGQEYFDSATDRGNAFFG
jgi:hypothetical protein